jgi:hypothetical protein
MTIAPPPGIPMLFGDAEPRPIRPKQREYNPPITPEEESSWLGKTMGMVQYAGETLDKPGAAVRGLMGGQGWDALKNLIPFSDTLGITDPKQRIYGEDLLERWGMVGPKDESGKLDWGRMLGGLGVDIAFDPFTVIGGPLSKGASIAAKASKELKLAGKAAGAVRSLAEETRLLKAGKIGDVVAHTPTTLSAAIRTGEAPVATLHAPFWAEWLGASKKPWMEFGAKSGPLGKAAAQGAAAINDFMAYRTPVRLFRGLLSPAATGSTMRGGGSMAAFGRDAQILNDLNYTARKQFLSAADNMMLSASKASAELKTTFKELGDHFKSAGDERAFNEFARTLVLDQGGIPDPQELYGRLRSILEIPENSPKDALDKTARLADEMYGVFSDLREGMNHVAGAVEELGGDQKYLQDLYIKYWPRSSGEAANEKAMRRFVGRLTGAEDDVIQSNIERKIYYRNIPEGEITIDALAKDPLFSGFEVVQQSDGSPLYRPLESNQHVAELQKVLGTTEKDLSKLRAQYARQKILPALDRAWPDKSPVAFDQAGNAISGEVRDLAGKQHTYASELESWTKDDSRVQDLISAVDALSPENKRAMLSKQLNGASKAERLRILRKLQNVGNGIWEKGVFDGDLIEDSQRNYRFMLNNYAALQAAHTFLAQPKVVRLAQDLPDGATLRHAWEEAGLKPKGLEKFVRDNAERFGFDGSKLADADSIAKALDELRITPGAEKALMSYAQMTQPKTVNQLLDVVDGVSSFYKTFLYTVWPASHIRDSISDLWQAGSTGYAPIHRILVGSYDAVKFMRKGIDPKYQDEFKMLGLGASADMIDALRNAGAAKKLAELPEAGGGLWRGIVVKGWKEGTANPLNIPGPQALGMLTGESFSEGAKMHKGLEIARNVQNAKNYIAQYGYFHALRESGYTPAQAKEIVLKTFFTGDEQSKFSRAVMSRAVLFWRFASNNVPFQLRKLAEQPGGRAAQTIRAITELSSQQNPDVYTPRFLQETQTFPFGDINPAAQSFFRNSVLPLNDLNDMVFYGGVPDVKRTALKMLSRLTPPALIGPELLADTQFSTGRKISDLESATEKITGKKIGAVDRLLHYLPTSRMQSEAWSLADPRKGWPQHIANVLGLGSVSNYDTEKWKNIDFRDALARELADTPEVAKWTSYYVPKSKQETMPPEKLERQKSLIKRRSQVVKQYQAMRKAKDREKAAQK